MTRSTAGNDSCDRMVRIACAQTIAYSEPYRG